MKTDKDIKRQVEGLLNMRKRLPAYGGLGTPNHTVIDVQIEIIQGNSEIEDIDEGDWEEMDEQNHVFRAAEEAVDWLEDEDADDLFESQDAPVEKSECVANFSIVKVEATIGCKTEEWKGNCYGIASMCLEKGLVPNGKLRYGHYRGPIHRDSMFSKSSVIGFCQHGWLELPDNMIWDPTRWVFENVEPYIYIGKNDHYDVGGNIHRMMNRPPAPKFNDASTLELVLAVPALNVIRDILDDHRGGSVFSKEQLIWISNENPASFGEHAKAIYVELERAKMSAFIPIDNWRMIME